MLLVDLFANIYSLESMGFGASAEFAEHLSLALGWSIDRIARNAGGASATREALADDLARHGAIVSRGDVPPTRERLADTKVVVWQFAMRELLSGDWRPVAMIGCNLVDGRKIVCDPLSLAFGRGWRQHLDWRCRCGIHRDGAARVDLAFGKDAVLLPVRAV
jgi:hypothetical protein